MQEIRFVKLNECEVPVLISDEKEALLAAKAAGRALIGLWKQGQPMDDLAGAKYVVTDPADVMEEYVERVARRHLGLPWNICETERLLIREMTEEDFEQICENQIGPGLETVEELRAYVKHQYDFFEFGFWALVEKASGELIGAAGLLVPEQGTEDMILMHAGEEKQDSEALELGYHIFSSCRRRGFALEACEAIMKYGKEYHGAERFLVRIHKSNEASVKLAERLGFVEITDMEN